MKVFLISFAVLLSTVVTGQGLFGENIEKAPKSINQYDTVQVFNNKGILAKVYCLDPKKGFEKVFYEDGTLRREVALDKEVYTYYYPNGKLMLTYTLNEKGGREDLKQYYESGALRMEQNRNDRIAYYENGTVAFKIERSEPYWFNRIVEGDKFRFYSYHYTAFGEMGQKLKEVFFTGTDMDYPDGFPNTFAEVPDNEYDKMVYYNEMGDPERMIKFEYITSTRFKQKTFTYEEGVWKAEKSDILYMNE